MRIIFFIARKITKVLNEKKISECFVREPCEYEVWRLRTVRLNPRLIF